jgi:chemotaxis protein histidine kinase CheA/CheY-like chemotaxis protein
MFAMKPASTACVLAEPLDLEKLARDWQDASVAQTTPQVPAPDLEAFREGLNALAEDAEARDRGAEGKALRRVALLSEVWECLRSEPAQEQAAADMASFCSSAMTLLARPQQVSSSDATAAVEWVLRYSDERWCDYLALVDPTGRVSEPASSDEQCFPEEYEPPAIDTQTLLRLITGSDDRGDECVPASSLQDPRHSSRNLEEPSARREQADCPSFGPETAIRPTPLPDRTPADLVPDSLQRDPQVPPLPTSLDLDDEMREAFLADATELFERIENLVLGLRRHSDPRGAIDELARCLHTLKGAAGSVGLSELATLVHALEERLEQEAPAEGQGPGQVSQGLNDLLHQFVNYLDEVIGLLRQGPSATDRTAPQVCTGAEGDVPGLGPGETAAQTQGQGVDGPIRVPAARFDELTDLAGELVVQGRFWLSQAESIRTFATTLRASRNRLLASLERLHEVGLGRGGRPLPNHVAPEADWPGELCRLAEQADDISVLAESTQAVAGFMADHGDTLVRLSHQLWDSFQSLRIVPIRGLFHRLARVLHEAGRVEGRQVEVVMRGEETGVDRAMQDKAFEPLLHVVRNAVGHGIEPPADRARACKPATGRVTLEARREGNTLAIVVEDDGKGLDSEAIADKARRLGWLAADETPTPKQLNAFIFQPGFSTRSHANEISGRGVGMDVVAREVSKLRGTVDLASQPGRGARITLRLPSQLAMETTLIVRVAGHGFAVPASQIESVQPFEAPIPSSGSPSVDGGLTAAASSGAGPTVLFHDQPVPVVFVSDTLGIGHRTSPPWRKLMLVRAGSRIIGLVVDTIEGTEDLVIKPLGALLTGHPLVSGTSLSVNGELICVLNPKGLERWLIYHEVSEKVPALASLVQEPRHGFRAERPTVLVVDDSISVRRGIARQLRGLGLEVHEVSDGMEALSRLRSSSYGLVVTDLEMPRLDGFALLAEMKRSGPLAAIPVVVASTLCDAETERRVLELGAKALFSKPVDPGKLARITELLLPGVGH